jgi:hypothetical protein
MRNLGTWWRLAALVIVLGILSPVGYSAALAADSAVAAPAATQASTLLPNILTIVATSMAGVLIWAAVLGAQKLGISISADQQAMLKSTAKSAIYYAEEVVAKKYGLDNLAGKGSEMLQAAITFATSKIPGVDPVELNQEIHAALGAAPGLGASGATGAPAGS